MFDRKKQIKWGALKVGIVVTVTLIIIFLSIIFSGGIQTLFQKRELIKIAIADVKGLRPGAPVRVSGIDVGEVTDIKLHKEYGTIVTASINSEIIGYLKVDAKASVQTIGLMGDKYVEIMPGQLSEPFDKNSLMQSYPQTEFRDMLTIASSTINRVDKLIAEIDTLVREMRDSKGTLYKFIKDPSLYNNLDKTVSELKLTIDELRTGSIGMISKDREIYLKLSNTVKNLEDFSNKISSSQGSLGRLMNEPDLYENLLSSSKRLEVLLQEIETSEGTFALLLRDKKTAEDLRQSVRELKELIEEIKQNPKKFFKFSIF